MGYVDIVQRKCAYCGKMIARLPVQEMVGGKELMFCNAVCLRKYKERRAV